ncbi:SH3 domain-containing protein, partial [Geminocystis sp. CENA526]
MNKFLSHSLKTLLGTGVTVGFLAIPLNSQQSMVSAQSTTAVVFDPPSNVRSTPNGQILCSVKSVTSINTYGSTNGWYITDVCGRRGYIHHSQIRFETYSESVKNPGCLVTNIRT